MIISDSHKFVFHHVPKTGGSSITAAIAPYCRNYEGVVPREDTPKWQMAFHQPHWMHHPISGYEAGDIPEGYYSFAFVRNPFSAVVSAWVPTKFKHFDEFVEHEIFTGVEIVGRYTQLGWLADEVGNLLVDFVGRFENLVEDFYKVVGIIGVPLMLFPKRNITKDKVHDSYREYYSPVSRRLIERKYKKDLEFFEYEF